MPLNIDDIKKLPVEERLKILDELLNNIDEDIIKEHLELEEDLVLRERLAEYEKGNMTFHSWEDVKIAVEENLKKLRREQ